MDLGSDVAMALDHCPPHTANENDIEDSLQRTHSWLQKCVETHKKSNQALFGIVQGGKYPRLREYSAKYTSSYDLPGIAVGGVSVGKAVEEIHSVINYIPKFLPIN